MSAEEAQEVPWTTAVEHCETIFDATPVELQDGTKEYARELAEKYDGELTSNPATVAASSVYLAGKINSEMVTQSIVGDPVGVSNNTVSRVYFEIAQREGIEIKYRGTSGEKMTEKRSIIGRLRSLLRAYNED